MARDRLAEVLAMGLNLLNGRESAHLTVSQVAAVADDYRAATKGPAFLYPDYTIEVYAGGRDGWKLHRYPNKAGLLVRIKDADVKANASRREYERLCDEHCRKMNAIALADIEAGRDFSKNPDWTAAYDEYAAFCKANGTASAV